MTPDEFRERIKSSNHQIADRYFALEETLVRRDREIEALKKRVAELEAENGALRIDITGMESAAAQLRGSAQNGLEKLEQADSLGSSPAAEVGPLSPAEGIGVPSSQPPQSGSLPLFELPAIAPEEKSAPSGRKRTPLQLWIEGALTLAEGIDLSCGYSPAQAKKVVNWGRDIKLLMPAFNALGAEELTARWKNFCATADDPFLARNRTLRYFASDTDKWRGQPEKMRRPHGDAHPDAQATTQRGEALLEQAIQAAGQN